MDESWHHKISHHKNMRLPRTSLIMPHYFSDICTDNPCWCICPHPTAWLLFSSTAHPQHATDNGVSRHWCYIKLCHSNLGHAGLVNRSPHRRKLTASFCKLLTFARGAVVAECNSHRFTPISALRKKICRKFWLSMFISSLLLVEPTPIKFFQHVL